MAWELHRDELSMPLIAASNIGIGVPVKLVAGSPDTCVLAASSGDRPFGYTAASALRGERVTVYEEGNYVKAIAAASVGAGAEVAVGSVNGGLTPGAAASGFWVVGEAFSAAAAGGVFTVRVKPRQKTI